MKLEKKDWQTLQTPILILAAVTAAVISLFSAAQYFNAGQALALHNQQNQLNIARQRYQSSGAEKAMIAEYLPRYQRLITKGFVGEERRIEKQYTYR